MTPKEKALNIYAKYHTPLLNYKGGINPKEAIELQKCAKQCGLIAVDEIIEAVKIAQTDIVEYQEYWKQVKQEIELL